MSGILVGMSGYAGSGKDTVGDILYEDFGFRKVSFAGPLKQAVYILNPIIVAGEIRVQPIVDRLGWDQAKVRYPEIRTLLQRMGTEVGRDLFSESLWVDIAMRTVKEHDDNCVITDVRFPNEATVIHSIGGSLWRVERPGTDPVNAHPSETAIDHVAFDEYIQNDGTIDDLRRVVQQRVGKLL